MENTIYFCHLITRDLVIQVPTWDLQLIAECIGFESTQPGRVLLQVPRFLLKFTHGRC